MQDVADKYFNKVYIECYGRSAEHSELEDYLKRTKARQSVTAAQLKKILSDSHWNYSRTWEIPNDEKIEGLADEIKDDLMFVCDNVPVKDAEARLITNMVNAIKNIEIVSVILAFLIPEKYCIIAPPPEHMIGFRRRSNKVDTLLRYFSDFQALAKKYDMKVFDLEKSLWTIYQMKYRIPDYDPQLTEQLWEKYLNESDILRIRVKNLLDEIWGDNIDDNLKSKILKEKDPEVALILAMRYFEHLLWKMVSNKLDKNELAKLKTDVKKGQILAKLMPAAEIEPIIMNKAHKIWGKRNSAMHIGEEIGESKITIDDVNSAIELNNIIN
jgi:hypothetical protein